MFQLVITGMCEDAKLPKVHWALTGLLFNADFKVTAVANAKVHKGEVVDATGGGADIVDVFKAWLAANRLREVRAEQVKEFQRYVGRSEAGYSSLIHRAVDSGLLKKPKVKRGPGVSYDIQYGSASPTLALPKPRAKAGAR